MDARTERLISNLKWAEEKVRAAREKIARLEAEILDTPAGQKLVQAEVRLAEAETVMEGMALHIERALQSPLKGVASEPQ